MTGDCTITIRGVDAKIEGTFPTSVVIDVTSYYAPGYQFTPRFKAKVWDGRTKLFRRGPNTFPAGLTDDVVAALRQADCRVQVIDETRQYVSWQPVNQVQLAGVRFDYPFEFQPACAQALLEAGRGIAACATNSGKTTIICLVLGALRLPSLVIAPGLDLIHQTRRVIQQRLGCDSTTVGLVGDAVWQPGRWITVASAATLNSRLDDPKCEQLLASQDVLILDECHRAGSDQWTSVINECQASFRFGFSGTPLKRTDGADLRLIGATGRVVYEIRNQELIRRGISVPPHIRWLKIRQPAIHASATFAEAYQAGIVDNQYRNEQLCLELVGFVQQGLSGLFLVDELRHGRIVSKLLKQHGVSHQYINGQEETETRQRALDEFRAGRIKVLVATSILNEGIDVPNIDALVLGGGKKSSIRTLQRVGRGLRRGGNIDRLYVVDTIDFQHRHLLNHSLQRFQDYKNESCFIVDQIK